MRLEAVTRKQLALFKKRKANPACYLVAAIRELNVGHRRSYYATARFHSATTAAIAGALYYAVCSFPPNFIDLRVRSVRAADECSRNCS